MKGTGRKGKGGRACVVVLGDLGRSPRMQYQALSLACQANLEVDIVAYGDTVSKFPSKSAMDIPACNTTAQATHSVSYASLVPYC